MLVSKDINMRIKARALGLPAEDYFNDKVLEDTDLLYTGVLRAARRLLGHATARTWRSWQQGGLTYYRMQRPAGAEPARQRVRLSRGPATDPFYAQVIEITGKTAMLHTLSDYTHQRNTVWGITARNREQNFALNLLMDPESTSSPCWARPVPARRC